MPKLVVGGFVIRAYMDDHNPPHVHVLRGAENLRVYLLANSKTEYVAGRMSAADERRALRIVAENREALFKLWEEAHR